jgi:cation transport ATPase-like protein
LYLSATTACLSAIIVLQVINVFLCRSSLRSVFSTGFLDNRLILWGVVVQVLLMLILVYTPLANMIIGTAPVPDKLWLFLLPFAGAMLVLEELRKWIVRRALGRASRAAPGRWIQYPARLACTHHETRAPSGVFSSTIAEAELEASSGQVTFGSSRYPSTP